MGVAERSSMPAFCMNTGVESMQTEPISYAGAGLHYSHDHWCQPCSVSLIVEDSITTQHAQVILVTITQSLHTEHPNDPDTIYWPLWGNTWQHRLCTLLLRSIDPVGLDSAPKTCAKTKSTQIWTPNHSRLAHGSGKWTNKTYTCNKHIYIHTCTQNHIHIKQIINM